MSLSALLFLMLGGLTYYLNQQLRLPVAPLPPSPAITGKWEALAASRTLLMLDEEKFTLSCKGKVILQGGYMDNGGFLAVWEEDATGRRVSSGWLSRPCDWYLRYKLTPERLVLRGSLRGSFGEFLRIVLAGNRSAGAKSTQPEREGVVELRRVAE
jgi:hypothetical protein